MCPPVNLHASALDSSWIGADDTEFGALPLQLGSEGEAVTDLQLRLVRLNLGIDDATGHFGHSTRLAVAGFQRVRGLRADGMCGRETWKAIVGAGFELGDRILYRRTPMMHGDDIADLQRRLSSLGFDPGGVDGIFGDRTAEGLWDFQRNVGLGTDGICGPSTIAELQRLAVRAGGHDLVSSVRERLMAAAGPATLAGRRVAVGEQGGFATGVSALCRALSARGTTSLSLHHPDGSELAAAANNALADCYVGLRLEPSTRGVRTMYYRGYRYESETSKRLAVLMASAAAEKLGLDDLSAEGMALPILRETRMAAVLVEVGPPQIVTMRVTELAQSLVSSLERWLKVDWGRDTSSTT
ncbi:MAG: peptidoglycan-binding protein [Acidimicrobiales bacterium]